MDEWRHVAPLVCLFAFAYALYGLSQHWRFATSIDLGIFDQAVWHLSRFERPASSILGLSNVLGDHFHPILALLAPLYWIAPAPQTLIVCQALLLASSIVPVFLFLQDRLPYRAAIMLCAAYGFFWGLQRAAVSDFHEIAFAPVLIATAIVAIDRRRWTLLWTVCLLLILVKEDLIPIVTFMGLYLALRGERAKGALLLTSSLLAFVLIVAFVIPGVNDAGEYRYAGSYADILRRPWLLPVALTTPAVKLRTMLLWFAPFVFTPLWSPLSMLLVPLGLERFLSANPAHWGNTFHHSAPIAPILAMSAGDGLARLAARIDAAGRQRFVIWVAGASAVLCSVLPANQPLWFLFLPGQYRMTAVDRAGYRAMALIPPDATVVAEAAVLPHLSQRQEIYVLTATAPDAEFIISSADLNPWPSSTTEELVAIVAARRSHDYTAIFDESGWVVLRRKHPV